MKTKVLRRLVLGSMLNLGVTHCGDVSTKAGVDTTSATVSATQALSNGLNTGTAYKIINKQSGLALDVSNISTANGALVWEYSYLGQSNQQWTLTSTPDGNVALVSINSNLVLDLPGSSMQAGTGLQQWSYWDQAANQRWSLQSDGSGAYFIKSAVSGMCIDAPAGITTNGTYVQQWGCWSGADNQKWYFTPVNAATPAPAPTSAPTSAPSAGAPVASTGLHVSGATLVDASGNPVRLHGANVPSLEWGNGEPNPYTNPCWAGQSIMDTVKKAFNDYHVNFIRLPISQDRWWNAVDGQGAAYRQTVYDIVNYVTAQGGYVDVDLHVSDMGVWGANSAQHFMPDDNTATVLADVASQFASNSHVLIGLYNEPHDVDWGTWRNGGQVNENGVSYHTPGIQGLINVVRGAGAKNVLIAGGLDWSFDLTGINQGYALSDDNLMYDAHIYPWKSTSDNWDGHISVISQQHPILIGEFGADYSQLGPWASPQDFLGTMHGWLNQHNYNYSAWNLHISSTPAMLADWCYNATPYFGAVVLPWISGN